MYFVIHLFLISSLKYTSEEVLGATLLLIAFVLWSYTIFCSPWLVNRTFNVKLHSSATFSVIYIWMICLVLNFNALFLARMIWRFWCANKDAIDVMRIPRFIHGVYPNRMHNALHKLVIRLSLYDWTTRWLRPKGFWQKLKFIIQIVWFNWICGRHVPFEVIDIYQWMLKGLEKSWILSHEYYKFRSDQITLSWKRYWTSNLGKMGISRFLDNILSQYCSTSLWLQKNSHNKPNNSFARNHEWSDTYLSDIREGAKCRIETVVTCVHIFQWN